MVSCTKQKRATLLEWKDPNNPSIPEQGGSRGYYTTKPTAKNSQGNPSQGQEATPRAAPIEAASPDTHSQDSAAIVARVDDGFHRTDLSTLRHLAVRRYLDRGKAHDPQSVAHRAGPGARPPLQLPSRLLEAPLVQLELGPHLDRFHPEALGSRRRGIPGGRRHGGRASRQKSLRQGLPSRCRALEPLVHRLPLRAQMGGVGHIDQVSFRRSALGLARVGSFVSFQGMGRKTRPTPQNAFGTDAATVGRVAALVPRTAVRVSGRWRLRHARTVPLCRTTPRTLAVGQPLLCRCQSVCAAIG